MGRTGIDTTIIGQAVLVRWKANENVLSRSQPASSSGNDMGYRFARGVQDDGISIDLAKLVSSRRE